MSQRRKGWEHAASGRARTRRRFERAGHTLTLIYIAERPAICQREDAKAGDETRGQCHAVAAKSPLETRAIRLSRLKSASRGSTDAWLDSQPPFQTPARAETCKDGCWACFRAKPTQAPFWITPRDGNGPGHLLDYVSKRCPVFGPDVPPRYMTAETEMPAWPSPFARSRAWRRPRPRGIPACPGRFSDFCCSVAVDEPTCHDSSTRLHMTYRRDAVAARHAACPSLPATDVPVSSSSGARTRVMASPNNLDLAIAVPTFIGSLLSFVATSAAIVMHIVNPPKRHFRHALIINLLVAGKGCRSPPRRARPADLVCV